MIVPGGGISLDGARWVACRPDFLLYVGVLSRLFRRLVLEKLTAAHSAGELQFFSKHAALANARAFAAYLAPLRRRGLRREAAGIVNCTEEPGVFATNKYRSSLTTSRNHYAA
jgi:hypothetical protein